MTQPFKILGINHLGIAPKNVDQATRFFGETLGLAHLGDELVKEQKTLTSMWRSSQVQSGDAVEPRLELLAPEAGVSDSPIAKFLEKKGGGIHHIALQVDDVDAAVRYLLQNGVRLIDEVPRRGAHNTKIAFIHPEAAGGILVELVQESDH